MLDIRNMKKKNRLTSCTSPAFRLIKTNIFVRIFFNDILYANMQFKLTFCSKKLYKSISFNNKFAKLLTDIVGCKKVMENIRSKECLWLENTICISLTGMWLEKCVFDDFGAGF